MKFMRGVCVSCHEEPEDWLDYKDGVWIQAGKDVSVQDAIKTAIRMRPNELVITSDCFGLFKITE